MTDAYERRSLLLHLGDVLESLYCLSRIDKNIDTLSDALRIEDSLSDFSWFECVDATISPQSLLSRATGAFFLWPKLLLDESLNKELLASTVQHDLFAGNSEGWARYVTDRREAIPWFGEGIGDPSDSADAAPEQGATVTRWPWPDEPAKG